MKKAFPSTDDIMHYLQAVGGEVLRRDIARAFHIKGDDRILLKNLLHKMVEKDMLRKRGKAYAAPQGANVFSLSVIDITIDGDVWASDGKEGSPHFEVLPGRRGRGASTASLEKGDMILVERMDAHPHQVHLLKRVEEEPDHLIGLFSLTPVGGIITPTSRKDRNTYAVEASYSLEAKDGDLVEARMAQGARGNTYAARVTKILGSIFEPKSLSLIAIHTHQLPYEFSDEALQEADKGRIPPLNGREDLRALELVTIDGEDARDFDDAVWAMPDESSENKGGHHLIVAIADVSYYVKTHSELDHEAYVRGNSVYFPDRVVPMLPEKLSNDLCSLRPDEDRGALAVHMWIDAHGKLLRHRFCRALIRSCARLTYEQVEKVAKGESLDLPEPITKNVIPRLIAAYEALNRSRTKRGVLELELPEVKIQLDAQGTVSGIHQRPRYISHRLIEEFMILANVAAAMTLTDHKTLAMFRVHDQPSLEKIDALRDFLQSANLSFPKGQVLQPRSFNQLITQVKGTPYETLVSELVLRSQAQAKYSPENIGHFGLHLSRYCHFTSPIRRYADLLVHRGLLKVLGSTHPEEFPYTPKQFEEMGDHISQTERAAAAAERETISRYITGYLAQHVGEVFEGTISGVSDFGFFVKIAHMGVDGMVPMRFLSDDFYAHDRTRHQLVGRRHKKAYTLGDPIQVTLHEADPVTGSMLFIPADEAAQESPRKFNRMAGRGKKRIATPEGPAQNTARRKPSQKAKPATPPKKPGTKKSTKDFFTKDPSKKPLHKKRP